MTATLSTRWAGEIDQLAARAVGGIASNLIVNRYHRTGREPAGNSARTSHVRNLSFSLRSLLALALRLVRIRQATCKPRSISLPTNICGYVALAAWLRMGTEGTRKQGWFVPDLWMQSSSGRGGRLQTCLFPSLNQFETFPPHHSFCDALRHPSPVGHVPRNLVPVDGAPPTDGVVVEVFDRLRRLAVFQRERILVPDKLVGLRKAYGWRLSLRPRYFLPFQHLRQRKYESVLELFAVVGPSACVALRGEDMPSKVACALHAGHLTSHCSAPLEPRSPRQPQLTHRLVPTAGNPRVQTRTEFRARLSVASKSRHTCLPVPSRCCLFTSPVVQVVCHKPMHCC
jgi:hypothetical protein